MEQIVGKSSNIGGKFLLSDMKKEKFDLLSLSLILKVFSKENIGKDIQIKTYYDTKDYLFFKNGINISINEIKGNKFRELVIRYDSEKKRISYLLTMPDTYTINIDLKTSITSYASYIASAISDMIPNGLQMDLVEVSKTLIPFIIATKKRERYKFVNNQGFKLIFSFDNVEYFSPPTRDKQKMDILEMTCLNSKEYIDMFNAFANNITRENPTIVEIQHSDLFIALDYLLNMKPTQH